MLLSGAFRLIAELDNRIPFVLINDAMTQCGGVHLLTLQMERLVHDDAHEPAMQSTSLVQIREVTPCPDERLLQNVLRTLIISHNQACHVQHVCPELLSDCAKVVGIALEDRCYQLLCGA